MRTTNRKYLILLFISLYLIPTLEITSGKQMAGTKVAQINRHIHPLNRGTCLLQWLVRTPGWAGPIVSSQSELLWRGKGSGISLHMCVTAKGLDKSQILSPNVVEPSFSAYALEYFFKCLGGRKSPEAFWAGEWPDQIEKTVLAVVRMTLAEVGR